MVEILEEKAALETELTESKVKNREISAQLKTSLRKENELESEIE